MKNNVFDSTDPILDLITRFLNEAQMLNISAAQAFIDLPKFVADPAKT